MLGGLAIECEVRRPACHRAGPVVVKATTTRVILGLAVVGRPQVPLAREAGDVAYFLHPVGDRQHGLSGHVRALWVNTWHDARARPGVVRIVREGELVLDPPGHQRGA